MLRQLRSIPFPTRQPSSISQLISPAMSYSSSSNAEASSSTLSPNPYACKQLPVIAVIGTTGVGKSKLSIQLAQHIAARYRMQHPGSYPPQITFDSSTFPSSSSIPTSSPLSSQHPPSSLPDSNASGQGSSSSALWRSAEVINADSMQVYRGLDIITNKVTAEETEGVPHRLLGVVDPKAGERGWGMSKWVGCALEEVRLPLSSFTILTGRTSRAQGELTLWLDWRSFKSLDCCPTDRFSSFRSIHSSPYRRYDVLDSTSSLPSRQTNALSHLITSEQPYHLYKHRSSPSLVILSPSTLLSHALSRTTKSALIPLNSSHPLSTPAPPLSSCSPSLPSIKPFSPALGTPECH